MPGFCGLLRYLHCTYIPYSLRITALCLLFSLLSTTAFCQRTLRRVIAKPGDGAHTLLHRYGLNSTQQFRRFIELNKKKLAPHNGLLAGRAYLLPAAVPARRTASAARPAPTHTRTMLQAPLFGPKYARVSVLDHRMRGAVYYLSAGHGGPDPGAIGHYGSHTLAEDEYAYDVTVRLARVLMQHDATVYVLVQDPNDGIRDANILPMDHDEVTFPHQRIPLNQLSRLRQRVTQANKLYAHHKGAYQRLLALHVDSRAKGQNIDVFFYHHARSQAGQRLAKNIHRVFTARYKRAQPNRVYSGQVSTRSSLYAVRTSHAPAVFMELGNIQNPQDQRRFLVADNRQALANWIYEGLLADYLQR